jgi:uncharacterized protein YllA (UPF0747 family)
LKTTPVGYERLPGRYPALFVGLAAGDPKALGFFPTAPLAERAKRAAGRGIEKAVLDRLRARHAELGAPPESLAALDKLGRGAAVVLTGQQPSPGWGPVYNLYKAAGALAAAAELESAGIPAVAMFWNHSDDVQRPAGVRFPDRDGGLTSVPFPAEEAGRPLYEAGSEESLRLFAAGLADRLPATGFSEALGLRIRAEHRGSIAESFSRALLGLLGPRGLVVAEPRDLEGDRAAALFEAHQKDPERLGRAVDAGRAAAKAAGFEDVLGKSVGLDLYEIRDGRRRRVERPFEGKGRPSAGVALRPLLQDAVLPACAYVAGPHEAGYLAELGPAYAAFGIEAASVLPRPSATLLEPRAAKLLSSLGGPERIFEAAPAAPSSGAAAKARGLAGRWAGELSELAGALAEDPAVKSGLEKTAARLRESLDAFAGRLEGAESRREDTREGRLKRLHGLTLPAGELQERVVTPLYYEALLGPGILGRIADAVGPARRLHSYIEVL